jgi:hypothetical protein
MEYILAWIGISIILVPIIGRCIKFGMRDEDK